MKKYLISLMVMLAFLSAQAKITMAPIFSDNMVLQRGKDVAIFGKSEPYANVTVSFAGQKVKTKAGKDGKWLATFKPMKASAENREMVVSDSTGDKVSIKNILVGEVWLCAGQSNMDCPIWKQGLSKNQPRYRAQNGGLFVQFANYDNIRFFIIRETLSPTPQDTVSLKWSSFRANNPEAGQLSACGAFFGMQLYQSLGVPIGLMDSNWGGTKIEAWTPACALKARPSLKAFADTLGDLKPNYTHQERLELKKQNKRATRHNQPTVLYNAMLNPLVPFTFRGAIWYQGCSNLGQGVYSELMHALYDGWSKKFNNSNLQFYFVQLAPFVYGKNLVHSQNLLTKSWEQQRKFAKEQPNAKMILTSDVGDLYDIHPYDKQTVGLRLAASALQHTYGFKSIKADFPEIVGAKVDGDKVEMSFKNVKRFYSRSALKRDGDSVKFMEIAGEDGKFVPADVEIKDSKLIAKAKGIANPKAIRFLYAPKSQCNIFNEYGLPLDSFNISLK